MKKFVLKLIISGYLLAKLPRMMLRRISLKSKYRFFKQINFDEKQFDLEYTKIKHIDYLMNENNNIPIYLYLNNSKNYVLIVHWYGGNNDSMKPFVKDFYQKGYSVLTYDQRNHGKNNNKGVTFSYLESQDLYQVINYVVDRYHIDNLILFGLSMGASTIGYYLGTNINSKVKCAILDSPFDSMFNEVYQTINMFDLSLISKILTLYGSVVHRIVYGYSFKDVDVAEQMKKCSIPCLVIYGLKDKKCPSWMSEKIYQNIDKKYRNKKVFKDSAHVCSYLDNKQLYLKTIYRFISENVD